MLDWSGMKLKARRERRRARLPLRGQALRRRSLLMQSGWIRSRRMATAALTCLQRRCAACQMPPGLKTMQRATFRLVHWRSQAMLRHFHGSERPGWAALKLHEAFGHYSVVGGFRIYPARTCAWRADSGTSFCRSSATALLYHPLLPRLSNPLENSYDASYETAACPRCTVRGDAGAGWRAAGHRAHAVHEPAACAGRARH